MDLQRDDVPSHPPWLERPRLARRLARMSRFPDAEQSFREEIRLYPRNREAYVRLAVLQTLTGRDSDATRTFEQMVRANPGDASHALAAETFRELGKPDAARKWSARGAR